MRDSLIYPSNLTRFNKLPFVKRPTCMRTDYCSKLLMILARLDQFTAEADAILAAPGDADIGARAEALREFLVEKRALIEEKLGRTAAT